jgi:Fe-S-cluster containining protein
MAGAEAGPVYQDIHLIAPMVYYLGYTTDHPLQVNPTDAELLGNPRERLHYYGCKNLDPATGDCTIYEIRPYMCRSYPNSGVCNYAKCTWRERKAKRETPAQRRKRKAALTTEVKEPSR